MTKKEALSKLKTVFRSPSLQTNKLKAVRDLYGTIKNLPIDDQAKIPDHIDLKMSKL